MSQTYLAENDVLIAWPEQHIFVDALRKQSGKVYFIQLKFNK